MCVYTVYFLLTSKLFQGISLIFSPGAPLALSTVPFMQEALKVCWSDIFSYIDSTHHSALSYSAHSVECLPYVHDLERSNSSAVLAAAPGVLVSSTQRLVWVTWHSPLHKAWLRLLCFVQAGLFDWWQPLFSKGTIWVEFKIPSQCWESTGCWCVCQEEVKPRVELSLWKREGLISQCNPLCLSLEVTLTKKKIPIGLTFLTPDLSHVSFQHLHTSCSTWPHSNVPWAYQR